MDLQYMGTALNNTSGFNIQNILEQICRDYIGDDYNISIFAIKGSKGKVGQILRKEKNLIKFLNLFKQKLKYHRNQMYQKIVKLLQLAKVETIKSSQKFTFQAPSQHFYLRKQRQINKFIVQAHQNRICLPYCKLEIDNQSIRLEQHTKPLLKIFCSVLNEGRGTIQLQIIKNVNKHQLWKHTFQNIECQIKNITKSSIFPSIIEMEKSLINIRVQNYQQESKIKYTVQSFNHMTQVRNKLYYIMSGNQHKYYQSYVFNYKGDIIALPQNKVYKYLINKAQTKIFEQASVFRILQSRIAFSPLLQISQNQRTHYFFIQSQCRIKQYKDKLLQLLNLQNSGFVKVVSLSQAFSRQALNQNDGMGILYLHRVQNILQKSKDYSFKMQNNHYAYFRVQLISRTIQIQDAVKNKQKILWSVSEFQQRWCKKLAMEERPQNKKLIRFDSIEQCLYFCIHYSKIQKKIFTSKNNCNRYFTFIHDE